jgi:hypothetical protein
MPENSLESNYFCIKYNSTYFGYEKVAFAN